jgi:serine-type D-Ala-D-Ala endopeptidase (penicillin-binding protein 7)
MVIITSIITTIILFFLNINPITIIQDNFFVDPTQASGKVLGIVEENAGLMENNLEAEILKQQAVFLPVVKEKNLIPVIKDIHMVEPDVSADSAAIFDLTSKTVLFEKNAEDVSSIASITKLITALVVLDLKPDLKKEYTLTENDRREGGRIFLFLGDTVTINDLFNVSLVGSGNTATVALVHALGLNEREFVVKMNEKAKELGLLNTKFVDPIGLSFNNVSTAFEVVEIIKIALEQEKIRNTVTKSSYILKTKQGKIKRIESTDQLLNQKNNYQIIGGKTGYLASAGFCFAGQFKKNGHEIISVVLNSNGVEQRFVDTHNLVTWAFDNYIWP